MRFARPKVCSRRGRRLLLPNASPPTEKNGAHFCQGKRGHRTELLRAGLYGARVGVGAFLQTDLARETHTNAEPLRRLCQWPWIRRGCH